MLRALVTLVLGVFLLTACSGGNTEPATPTPSAATEPTATPTEAPPEITADGLPINQLQVPDFAAMTPTEAVIAYAKYVLKQEFVPENFPELVYGDVPEYEVRQYTTRAFAVGDKQLAIRYFSTIKGAQFDRDGVLVLIHIELIVNGIATPGGGTAAQAQLQQFMTLNFKSNVESYSPGWTRLNAFGGPPAFEIVWANRNGSKEARYTYPSGTSNSSGVADGAFGAAILFKGSPAFARNTFLPRTRASRSFLGFSP